MVIANNEVLIGGEMRNESTNTLCLAGVTNADEILEKSEAADRLKISTRTLDEWMRRGRVPFLKIGKTVRFRWNEVLAQLEQNCRVN